MITALRLWLSILPARLQEQRGAISLRGILAAVVLIVAFKLYPDMFFNFLHFLREKLMGGIEDVGKAPAAPSKPATTTAP